MAVGHFVATPPRDVVLELAPRLAKAFPDISIATLYGGSTERWKDAQLTLATTHQLMRFYRGFDLVIIDELDAFPYHNDPMLAHAATNSCKPDGHFVYLSATPSSQATERSCTGKIASSRECLFVFIVTRYLYLAVEDVHSWLSAFGKAVSRLL